MNALWDKFYLNKYDTNPHPGMIKAFNETMAMYNTLSLSGSLLSTNGTPVILVVEHLRELDQQFDFEKYDHAHQIQAIVLLPPSALEHVRAPNFDTNLQQFQAQTDMLGLFVGPRDKLFRTLTNWFDDYDDSE